MIKVGDGRWDLAAEGKILRYPRDRSKEAVCVTRLVGCSPTSSISPYLALEKYGEDIRPINQLL